MPLSFDEPEFDGDKMKDAVKNPAVIFEILSPSTEEYDIGRKQMYYMQIESLQQYTLADYRTMHMRVITKREKGTWRFAEYVSTNDKIFIEPIGFEVAV